MHVSRLLHPLTVTASWVEYDGTSVVSKIWSGRASLFELEAKGSAGRIEGAGIRLYNPQSRQWSLNWVSSADGHFQGPMFGQFENGRGQFFDHEVFDGKSILVRNTFSNVSAAGARFEQAFSADGGHSWEPNWVMTFTRMSEGNSAPARYPSQRSSAEASHIATHSEGEHGFDFAFGAWKTHIRRLKSPLSGSYEWVEYDGTHTIRKVWGGRANLGELEADGPSGHIEAMSPRFYDPQTQLWSVNYGNPRDASLSTPVVGTFKNGRGEFYGQDMLRGRAVLVRELYLPVDANTRRLEVAYSQDGGRTWETNWVMIDTRASSADESK